MKITNFFNKIEFIAFVLFIILLIINFIFCYKIQNENKTENFKKGYLQACKDFYTNKLKIVVLENQNNYFTNNLTAWDDKNYFDISYIIIVKPLNNYNIKNYYSFKRFICPKCKSYNIIANEQKEHIIISLKCKDCGYIWKN